MIVLDYSSNQGVESDGYASDIDHSDDSLMAVGFEVEGGNQSSEGMVDEDYRFGS